MKSDKWYCGGYGGRHIIPGGGRHWFACSKCRWSPNHVDSEEQKQRVLESVNGKEKRS